MIRILNGFQMQVLAYDPYPVKGLEAEYVSVIPKAKMSFKLLNTVKVDGYGEDMGQAPLEVEFTDESVNAQSYVWYLYKDTIDLKEKLPNLEDSLMDNQLRYAPDFTYTYEHPGLYQYELKQIIPEKKEGYTYDETVWTARVYVTNGTSGDLIADVLLPLNTQGQKANEETPVHRFRNSYAAEVKKPGNPGTPAGQKQDPKKASQSHTGENSGSSSWVALMMVGLAGLMFFVFLSRREKQKGDTDGQ